MSGFRLLRLMYSPPPCGAASGCRLAVGRLVCVLPRGASAVVSAFWAAVADLLSYCRSPPIIASGAPPPCLRATVRRHILGRRRVSLVIPFDDQLGMLVGEALPLGESIAAPTVRAAAAVRPADHCGLPPVPTIGDGASPPHPPSGSDSDVFGPQLAVRLVIPLRGHVGTLGGEVVGRCGRRPGARRAASAPRPVAHYSLPPMIAYGASPPDLPVAPGCHVVGRRRVSLVIPFDDQVGMLVGDTLPRGGFPTAFRAAAASRPGGHSSLPPMIAYGASPPRRPCASECHILGLHLIPVIIPLGGYLGKPVGEALPRRGFPVPIALRAASAASPVAHSRLPPMSAILGGASPPRRPCASGCHILGRHLIPVVIPLGGYLGKFVGEALPRRGFPVPTTSRAASAVRPPSHWGLPPVPTIGDGASPPRPLLTSSSDVFRFELPVRLVIPLRGQVRTLGGEAVGRCDRRPGARRATPAARPGTHCNLPLVIACGASPPRLLLASSSDVFGFEPAVRLLIPLRNQVRALGGEAVGRCDRRPGACRATPAPRPANH